MLENDPKKGFYVGWNCVGWHEVEWNIPYFIYEIDQRKKFNTLGDFENLTPTHLDATHALQNFQNLIPRELNQNPYTSGIGINHWISSNFLNYKNRRRKKVIPIWNPGIQPRHVQMS